MTSNVKPICSNIILFWVTLFANLFVTFIPISLFFVLALIGQASYAKASEGSYHSSALKRPDFPEPYYLHSVPISLGLYR